MAKPGYPLGFRKHVVDYAVAHPELTDSAIGRHLGVNSSNVKRWKIISVNGYAWRDIPPCDRNGAPIPLFEE